MRFGYRFVRHGHSKGRALLGNGSAGFAKTGTGLAVRPRGITINEAFSDRKPASILPEKAHMVLNAPRRDFALDRLTCLNCINRMK
jgi:hypothetical protein